jgi:membrane-associated phospholipid phosphatase
MICLSHLCVLVAPRVAFAQGAAAQKEPQSEQQTLKLSPGALPPVVYPKTALRVGVIDAVLSGVGATMAVAASIAGPNGNGPRGTGTPFDEAVRDALLPDSFDWRLLFRDTSDALLGASISYAFIGDALIHATWLRKSPDVGIQMALIDAEVTLLTLGVSQLTAHAVGRERPYGRECGNEFDEDSAHCTWNDRYLSFFSTHSSLSFAMAAVTCAHHNALGLSGRHPWIPCAVGFTAAAVTAFSRIMADQHYFTDVVTGAAVGTLVGFAVPAVHYGIGGLRPRGSSSSTHVTILPTLGGVTVRGVW